MPELVPYPLTAMWYGAVELGVKVTVESVNALPHVESSLNAIHSNVRQSSPAYTDTIVSTVVPTLQVVTIVARPGVKETVYQVMWLAAEIAPHAGTEAGSPGALSLEDRI